MTVRAVALVVLLVLMLTGGCGGDVSAPATPSPPVVPKIGQGASQPRTGEPAVQHPTAAIATEIDTQLAVVNEASPFRAGSLLSDSEKEELEAQLADARLLVDMVIECSDGYVVDPIAQGGTAEDALLEILALLTPELQSCVVDRLEESR